jgi:ATP-dependent DNA helicase UvrD/PcrA
MTRLTPEQRVAVTAGPGPVRVVAGPGTGKTTVIVERFLRLVAAGVEPSRILLVTFTERAAREMRGRLEARMGAEAALSVSTFHAAAQQWLREEGRRAGVPEGFSILTGAHRWVLAYELLWRLADDALVGVEHPERQISGLLRTLERLKQELIPLSAFARAAQRTAEPEQKRVQVAAARFFGAYAAECRRRRLLDFDDLLERAVHLLESDQAVLERYRARYPWVLVDEYQDTNLAQERIVELLAGDSEQVYVVGDDDQSIYRFRGASRASMERFTAAFPAQATVFLTQNRRSTRRISSAATRLIAHNADRVAKPIESVRRVGRPVEIWRCPDAESEGAAIAREINALVAAGTRPAEIAILTRTNAVARPIARALAAAGVPYRAGAWSGFFDHAAVKDLVAALRLIADADDAVAAFRLERGFGELTAPDWQALAAQLREEATWRDVRELFFDLMERSRFLDRAELGPALRFGELLEDFCERTPERSLSAFLGFLLLVELSGLEPDLRDADVDVDADAVSLMTIHQAKGLEFDAVFVPCLVEGRLPQPSRRERFPIPPGLVEPAVRGREDHLAEERRLSYVALTRARARLYLSWAPRYEGDRSWRRSRFLDELLEAAEGEVRELDVPPVGVAAPKKPARRRPRAEPLALSYSALSAYRECPRQHWFRYQRRLPAERTAEGHLGDAVHRALRAAAQVRSTGGDLDEGTVRGLVEQAWAEESFPDPKLEAVYRRLASELTLRYLGDPEVAAAMFHVEHLELPFETAVNGFRLRGVIDRIDAPAAAGEPHVLVDYKTGAPAPASRLRRDLQLALYAIGARRELGLEEPRLRIDYLRDGKSITLSADQALLDEAEKLVVELGDGIAAGAFEPRPEPRRCALCSYRLACDASV